MEEIQQSKLFHLNKGMFALILSTGYLLNEITEIQKKKKKKIQKPHQEIQVNCNLG